MRVNLEFIEKVFVWYYNDDLRNGGIGVIGNFLKNKVFCFLYFL